MLPTTKLHRPMGQYLCILGVAASAQSALCSIDDQGNRGALEEVIVTAERRESNLQETPVSVTALTGNALQAAGASDVRDIESMTPGLVIGGLVQLGTNPVSIRGIGTNPQGVGADNSVATYLDGVYLGRAYSTVFDLVDVERIEVLRGPQGTLYGRNATGGAISIITKKPDDEPYYVTDLRIAERNEYRVRALASGPLVGQKLYGQVSASYGKRDGYSENRFNGHELNGEESQLVRTALRYVPTDYLEINILADYGEFDATPQSKNINAGTGDPDHYDVNVDGRDERTNYGVNLTIDYAGDVIDLTSITSARRSDMTGRYDSDGTSADILSLVPQLEDQEQISQEFRISSTVADVADWMLGLYYYHEVADSYVYLPFTGLSNLDLSASNSTDSYAAFGQVTWNFSSDLSATLGLRYSNEDKEFDFEQIWNPEISGVFQTERFDGLSTGDTSVTPKFVVDYAITDYIYSYVSASKGFKSGGYAGYNIVTPNTEPSAFDPENLWAYEVGIKSDALLGGTSRLNVSAFYYDYDDLQVRIFDSFGFAVIENAGTAEVKGLEFELTSKPTDSWMFFVNGTYLDAEYTDFSYQSDSGPVDNSGNALTRSPKYKLGATVQYEASLSTSSVLKVRLGYDHRSRTYFDDANTLTYSHGEVDVFNLRAAVESRLNGKNFTVSAFVRNLTDKRYKTQVIEITSAPQAVFNMPRTIGLEARVEW